MKKKVLILLSVAFILFLSQCKTVEDIFDSTKDYGDYTSITIRFTVTFKGLNSIGSRTVTVADTKHVDEDFVYTKKYSASDDITCENAETDKTHTFDVTVYATSFTIALAYIDWDYYGYVNNATNYKLLCSEWSASVQGYSYTSGKDDPGSPLVSGLDELALDLDSQCTGTRVHDCLTEANITITRNTAGDNSNIQSVFTSTSNMKTSM